MRLLGFIGLKDADRRLILETMEQAIALTDRSDAKALQECEALFTEVATRARRMPPKIFSAMLLPVEEKAAAKFVRLEAHRRTMLVALAVERYRWRHNGQLPDRLEQLAPDLLPTLPPDPFDDNPLRYKRLPAGFMVYSIGPDRLMTADWSRGRNTANKFLTSLLLLTIEPFRQRGRRPCPKLRFRIDAAGSDFFRGPIGMKWRHFRMKGLGDNSRPRSLLVYAGGTTSLWELP